MFSQVTVVVEVTVRAVVRLSVACAVSVAVLGAHGFAGIQLPLNGADWPIASGAGVPAA